MPTPTGSATSRLLRCLRADVCPKCRTRRVPAPIGIPHAARRSEVTHRDPGSRGPLPPPLHVAALLKLRPGRILVPRRILSPGHSIHANHSQLSTFGQCDASREAKVSEPADCGPAGRSRGLGGQLPGTGPRHGRSRQAPTQSRGWRSGSGRGALPWPGMDDKPSRARSPLAVS